MVLNRPSIHHPIKVASIIGIWTINYLIPSMEAELMGRQRRTREGNEYLCIRAFPKDSLILKHYMLISWWLHLLGGLGNYVILPGKITQSLMMTNNVMALGYNYTKIRLKKPPNILF